MRILSTGVEEYKDFIKRPSKEIDRVKEEIAVRTRLLEERGRALKKGIRLRRIGLGPEEDRTKAVEEKIKGMEERLKRMEGKVEWVSSKQLEAEKTALAKETSGEGKGPAAGIGDLYKDAYETFKKGTWREPGGNLKPFSNSTPTPNSLTMPSSGSAKPTIRKRITRRQSWNMRR